MKHYYADDLVTLWHGDSLDVLTKLPDGSVDCCVTSPPYFGLRDYGVAGQIGAEPSPAEFVAALVAVFHQVRRVLADDGTLWLNIGDSYSAKRTYQVDQSKAQRSRIDYAYDTTHDRPAKNLLGIPWRTAFALQDDGWILRNAIIWHKPNAMPESVTDRLSTRYEHLFLFSKSRRYWFDLDPIREALAYPDAADGTRVFGGVNKAGIGVVGSSERRTGGTYGKKPTRPPGVSVQSLEFGGAHDDVHPQGRNPGDVWTIPTVPFPGAHFAAFPPELPRRCIAAGCKPGGTVLDPFHGSGTTGMVAQRLGRRYIGIDLNAEYLDLSLRTRLANGALPFETEGETA